MCLICKILILKYVPDNKNIISLDLVLLDVSLLQVMALTQQYFTPRGGLSSTCTTHSEIRIVK